MPSPQIVCQNCRKSWSRPGTLCCENHDVNLYTIRDAFLAEHYGCDPDELYPPAWVDGRLVWAIVAKRQGEGA